MKNLIPTLALLVATVYAGSGFAASDGAAAPLGKQQNRMTDCNAEATGLTGDERKAFMKSCLSNRKPSIQQSKMRSCNVDAKGLKGDQRKDFMKQCLRA